MILQRLLDTLSQDEPEVRRRLADMTRKITVLRVNEKALTRRFIAMQEMEGAVRKVRKAFYRYPLYYKDTVVSILTHTLLSVNHHCVTHMKVRGISAILGNWVSMTYLILLGHSARRVHLWDTVQAGYIPRMQKNPISL